MMKKKLNLIFFSSVLSKILLHFDFICVSVWIKQEERQVIVLAIE